MRSFIYLLLLTLPFFISDSSYAQNKIAYLTNESGNFDIFIIDENGNNKQQLTTNKGWDWSPKWNAELQAIIYNSNDTLNKFSIKLISINGTEKKLDTKGMEEFILSPNGTKVLYTLKDNNNRYIGVFDLVKSTNRLLVSNPSYNGRPDWSPNGDYFSFISDRDGNNELYVYDFKKAASKRLTNSKKSEKYTSWMPDSRAIVYTYHYSDERNNEHNDIFSVNLKTNKKNQITNNEKFYQEIDVSPDGKKIVFHAKRNSKDQLYTIDISGKNEKQITTSQAYHGEPEWVSIKKQ
ncbi:DPP IV N-terminal domain-containing protein [Psychroserpens luteolus]|uniref:DPP IV N-terminal domain-containing protein n=1 Tax=Psychroserpens luteolus TaxID=2855840 RepID=UPI001E5C3CF2|nr:DPP IV N-terminal domain-containing protein [Psychroserpens luteolus]MCD2260189.1 DPP IV N-terminal domain-containing protein [Psychroserpens luteolus]